jgi:hypothetical protein
MRMAGHAQHDQAEYVPREMLAYWKERELAEDLAFAESSPLPAPETAEQGVYCEGCHTVEPRWQRAQEELLPPQSSIRAAWDILDYGDFVPPKAAGAERRPKATGEPRRRVES